MLAAPAISEEGRSADGVNFARFGEGMKHMCVTSCAAWIGIRGQRG